jgi:restriction system protein
MARFWLSKGVLVNELFEVTGFKAGVCIEFDDMLRFVEDLDYCKILKSNLNNLITIRAEEYEDMYYSILQGVGHIPKDIYDPRAAPGIVLCHKYRSDKEKLELALKVYEIVNKWFFSEYRKIREQTGTNKMPDPTPAITECKERYGYDGAMLCLEILEILEIFINRQDLSPFNKTRRVEWRDVVELKDLFETESLDTYYGSFIDQRYIDYLSNHFDKIGEINRRKFEALTCEYFDKNGFHVKIGKGRDDGEIDARIWKSKDEEGEPPLILVQCKREKEKVGKVVVKALWADIQHEKAMSGLIVTSSEVSKGAKDDCNARGYKIGFSERKTLRKWVAKMRTPYSGIFIT